jgi:GTPase SAR1 family protein
VGALIVGPSGVGKTTLATALLQHAPVQGVILDAEAAYRCVVLPLPLPPHSSLRVWCH